MKIIAYHRVSTVQQGHSGLGLEAQEQTIQGFARSKDAAVIASYTEVESGKHNDRPELAKALRRAEVTGATLVIAKLDRLSRNAAFLYTLRDSGVDFIAVDMPEVNTLTLGVTIAMAQHEREVISERTTKALAIAKARGVKLGNPNGAAALRKAGKGNTDAIKANQAKADKLATNVLPIIREIMSSDKTSLRAVADELNRQHIRTARGGTWYASSVKNLLARAERLSS